jgi:autotransporter translocation and assembly factor TamB
VRSADLRLRAGRQLTGEIHVTGGTLPIAAAVGTLRDVAADVTIDERAITGTIDGKLGRGTIRLAAAAATDLSTIDVRELRLRNVSVLGGLRPIVSAKLGTADHEPLVRRDGVLRGALTVEGASITFPEHPGTPLLDADAPTDLVFAGAREAVAASGPRAPAHPWLVVDLALGPTRLEARNVVGSVGLGGKGTLRSKTLTVSIGDTVGVRGNLAIDNAHVDFLGRRYLLEASGVEFDGTIDPVLEIHMTHQFPALALKVDVRGRASQPEPQLSSDLGGYSRDQLVGFFVGGEPGGDPSSQTGEAVKGALALGISGQLGRRINKVLPVKLDALSCEPATTATSASCAAGKWLSQRLFLTYRQHLEPRSNENANDLQLQYRLGRKALIDMAGGDRGHLGLDLLWRHRW